VLVRTAVTRPHWRRVLVVVMVVCALPHLISMAGRQLTDQPPGLDGLRWMSDGDRAVVDFLREQPSGTVIVEAVGGAYTDYGRFSAASGVPALLGWENHEMVWRGNGILDETGMRKSVIDQIYRSQNPDMIRRLAADHGVDFVIIGTLERQDFDAAGLAAVRQAGEVVLEASGAAVVAFPGMMER
jgi:uncharacterized membrane protein